MTTIFRAACVFGALVIAQLTWAQSSSTSGTSATTCTQTGGNLVCTTTTTVALPSGTNLSGMSLNGSAVNAPACTSFTASPSVITPGANTAILLTVNCPTSATYTYTWASPVQNATGSSTTHALTLGASSAPQPYSVQVCFAANPTACSTYSTSVSVPPIVTILSLTGCSAFPATSTINVGGAATLRATCNAGTEAGSNVAYQWSRNGSPISGATGSTYSLSASDTATAGTATYLVQITNGAPSSNNATASATVTTNTIVAGPTDYCPSTPVRATIAASAIFQRVWTADITSSFPAGATFVIQVNVNDSAATVGRYLATLNFSDAGSERGGRYVTLSKSKCDFTEGAQWLSPNFRGTKTAVNAGSASIKIKPSDTRTADVNLDTDGVWYLNIQNVIGACPAQSSCHAVLDWAN